MTFVYFIHDPVSDTVKIGKATDVNHRLSSLRVGTTSKLTIAAVVPGDERYEAALHEAFDEYHVSGEWYRNEGRLRRLLEVLPSVDTEEPEPKRVARSRDRAEIEKLASARTERRMAALLPMIRSHVESIGVDVFATAVGAKKADVVKSMQPDSGRYFRAAWFMHLLRMVTHADGEQMLAEFTR